MIPELAHARSSEWSALILSDLAGNRLLRRHIILVMDALIGAVTITAASAIAHLRGAYSSALAQCAVLANRKYVALVVDRVVTVYDDNLHGDDVGAGGHDGARSESVCAALAQAAG